MDDEVANLANAAAAGDRQAAERLLPIVYDHLREMARRRLSAEPAGQTLQPTALVHEAFLRLTAGEGRTWADQRHFLVAASLAMRRILVERARAKHSIKRGGDRVRMSIEEAEGMIREGHEEIDWVAVDSALRALSERDPALAVVVQLRYFAGLTVDQTAEALGRSPRSVDRDWNVARAWLLSRLTHRDTP